MKTSNIGSPLMFSRKEQTKAPTTSSSHTGTTTKGILSRLYKNLTSSILISTPVGPMKTQNVPDVKKPDQLFALRGTVSQPKQQTPSNLMAGAPSPKPLSGAPKPPGGNAPPPIMSGALGGGGGGNAPPPIMSGALGGGGGGGAKPPVQGPLPTPGMIPGVPRNSRVECTNNKCKLTTAPSSAIQGVIRMTVPVDKANHPLLSQIKEVSFIPGTAAATLGVPIKKTRHVIVRRLKNGKRVVIKRLKDGRVVRMPGTIIKQTLPNGQVIEVRKLPDGRTIPVKPVPKAAFAQPIGPGRIFGPKQPIGPGRIFGPKQPIGPGRIFGQKQPVRGAPPHLRKGRRIILRRTDGRSEYINVLGIDVFDQNGNRITDNVTASMGPQVYANDPGQFGAQYLIDGVHTERRGRRGRFYRLPHTTNVPNAHMTVNLGSDRLISKIVVWNRTECCSDRIIGCNLRIRNSNNDLLIDHRISQNRPVYTFTFGPKGVIVN